MKKALIVLWLVARFPLAVSAAEPLGDRPKDDFRLNSHQAAGRREARPGEYGSHGSVDLKKDLVLYKHEGRYSAFPGLTKGAGDQLWVDFGWNTTRSHYGKAAGGETGGIGLFSPDGGATWYQQTKDAPYQPRPERLSGLVLSDGTIVRVGPRMHEVLPGEKKDELVKRGIAVKEWPDGHVSASYRVIMHRKRPDRDPWETRQVELPPFASMGGFGRGCVLPDDTILKPVYNKDYLGGGRTRLKEGLSGDHSWYLNGGPDDTGDYPNGSTAPGQETDLAFKVYADLGPLPGK